MLVGLALYLLYNFNKRQEDLKRLALDSDALQLDPLLFLMPALFALGGGLLVLRVYPWFIRLVYWAGRKMVAAGPLQYAHTNQPFIRAVFDDQGVSGHDGGDRPVQRQCCPDDQRQHGEQNPIRHRRRYSADHCDGRAILRLRCRWLSAADADRRGLRGDKRMQYTEPPFQAVPGAGGG